jgi:hypothetical protein
MNDQPNLIGYLFSPDEMQRLRAVEKGLYGDGSLLTADARRDLANLLNITLSRAEAVDASVTVGLAADALDEPVESLRPDHCPCGLPWDECPVNKVLNTAVAEAIKSGCNQIRGGAV